jgi:putative exosortase-associated protein (TIGR04073 family)
MVIGFMVLAAAQTVNADSAAPYSADRITRKLGRGVINILTCPAELLRVPTMVSRKEGTLSGISVGVVQGVWQMIRRGAAGLYDLATFPFNTPGASLVQPEFVWAHGNWAE